MNQSQLRRIARAGILLGLCSLLARPADAVVLDNENRLTIALHDGTQITLLGEASSTAQPSRNYYYLPVNLRLGKRPDGVPEFLFVKYTTEAGPAGVSGAVMHFLMEWGLTADQQKELGDALTALFPTAHLMGAVPMEPEASTSSFQIVSATLSDDKLGSVVSSGKAPLVAGGKAAAGAKLSKEGAQLMASNFERTRSIADLSIALNYGYSTLVPAARGSLTIDWSKMEQERESLITGWKQTPAGSTTTEDCFLFFCTTSTRPNYTYSYEESYQQYKFLEEKKIVSVSFDELVSDERVGKIREAFFQYFLNTMSEPADEDTAAPASDKEKDKSPESKYGRQYAFNRSLYKSALARKTQRFDLSYRMTVKWPFQLVGNLASWYDAVKDNKTCVDTIVLNDPFFQARDIRFVLDLDAKDIFDKINMVQAQVRKKRTAPEHDFVDHFDIDEKYLREKGVAGALTYARGSDPAADTYEYRIKWNLRGNIDYPSSDPPWEKGTWEGITLGLPVVAHAIQFEGDLAELKASDITRATAQIRYSQFGKELEENIQLSPASGQPLVSKTIFIDRGSRGYAYRLVINHKTEGKMALDWSPVVGDDYIYASIPPEVLAVAAVKAAAKEAARTVADNILDKFKDVLGPGR
jgi:hypothetical protein